MGLRARTTALAGLAALTASLIAPDVASAHATAGKTYEFQLPIWLYAVAGGLTVLLSVPIAVAAGDRPSWISARSWSPSRGAAIAARIARWLLGACLVIAVAGGLFGSSIPWAIFSSLAVCTPALNFHDRHAFRDAGFQ